VVDVAPVGSTYTVIVGNKQESDNSPKAVLKRTVAIGDRLPTEFWMPRY
jgi:hypothetical protein